MSSTGTCWEILRPTGAGSNSDQDSGTYADVDDYVADTSDYIQSAGNGTDEVTFASPTYTTAGGTITAVGTAAYAKIVGAGACNLYPVIDSPILGINTLTVKALTTSWALASSSTTTFPDTGAAWAWSDLANIELGFRLEKSSSPTVRVAQSYGFITFTGVFWRDGAPNDGTGFTFVECLDTELRNYLKNYHPLVSGNHADLTNYLETESVFYDVHDPLTELQVDVSKSKFPRATIWTTEASVDRGADDKPSSSLLVRGRTRIILRTHNARPETAGKQWWAIAGAMSSLLQTTRDAPSNPAWAVHYANWEHPTVDIGTPVYNTEADEAGTVSGELTVSWAHLEDYPS